MAAARILILGCGFTGKRVASRLLRNGHQVIATARDPASIANVCSGALRLDVDDSRTLGAIPQWITPETRVLYSLPSIGQSDLTPQIVKYLAGAHRIVYLSTTGVYGKQRDVDRDTPANPQSPREWLRVQAEEAIAAAFANSLILRPAAIYGPHRGIHASMRAGTYRLAGNGSSFVSRIHVDDLATHCIQALLSDLTGAYPVADEHPCPSMEIAAFCANLLGTSLPPAAQTDELGETRQADRRVDGSAIRQALGIQLAYPDYRAGIPACIAAEELDPAPETAEAKPRAR